MEVDRIAACFVDWRDPHACLAERTVMEDVDHRDKLRTTQCYASVEKLFALFAGKSTLNSLHMRPLASRCATLASGPKRLAIVGLHLFPGGPIPNRLATSSATSTTRIAHCTAIRTKDLVTAICCSARQAAAPPSIPAPARSRIVGQIREACPTCDAMASSTGSHAEAGPYLGDGHSRAVTPRRDTIACHIRRRRHGSPQHHIYSDRKRQMMRAIS
ncbi:hypothetical protein FHT76_007276 [Rhizobium sp. BK176]|nr:hypothetical protein [Rhizobium sp. BK181]MBB3544961.1 hypothetical protein [Rhizobium sp. BK399]MCS4095557.1 hypothetical protein [Rhizobium sp. BK176]